MSSETIIDNHLSQFMSLRYIICLSGAGRGAHSHETPSFLRDLFFHLFHSTADQDQHSLLLITMEEIALKAAKKALKKDGEMKLSQLTKAILAKLGDAETVSKTQVKEWLTKSSKFTVQDKMVSLTKKRSVTPVAADDTTASSSNKKPKTATASDPSDMAAWRKEHCIVLMHATDDSAKHSQLNEDPSFYPFSSFDAVRTTISPALVQQCVKNKFTNPTPIQAQSWPILCTSRDMVGIAETGSGKTLGFALPVLSRMADSKRTYKSPRMLVLAPTRELAMQSHVVLEEFGAAVGLKSLVVYGGVPKGPQVAALKQGDMSCVVATPGRLKDLMEMGACKLSQVEYLVLDEADRMLDMVRE